jgi:superfamily II DNA/RNA helicase
MIWHDGVLPAESPPLGRSLTEELLSYGFGLLRLALKARELGIVDDLVQKAFELSAESLESVVRNGDPTDEARGFYRVVAAASYHLGGFSARAYSLLAQAVNEENAAEIERAFGLLMLRRLDSLQSLILKTLSGLQNADEVLTRRLDSPDDPFDLDDALSAALTENYLRALAAFLFALRADDEMILDGSQERLNDGEHLCASAGLIPTWWIYRMSKFLTKSLWDSSIQRLLPMDSEDSEDWPKLRELFVALLASRATAELDLWPSQLDAASRIMNVGDDIIASLPTSAGKTRIAELCILRTLSLGQRALFVTPLRALSAQTERTLRATFGPLGFDVSSLYGSAGTSSADLDSLSNRDIVVSTPEKLDFALRNNPGLIDDVGLIVLDEGHMLGPREREVRYEVLIQRLLKRPDSPRRRIVCLSAMFPSGDQMDDFVNWLREDEPGGPVTSLWRPTRQRFGHIEWRETAANYELRIEDETTTFIRRFILQTMKTGPRGGKIRFPDQQNDLVLASAWRLAEDKMSVLIYCPERRSANAVAKRALKAAEEGFLPPLADFDPTSASKAVAVGKEWLGAEHPVLKCLSLGIAVHHGALPRPFLREMDILIRDKQVPVIVASPTLARGLNISATCVLFQSCERYDRSKKKRLPISVEEFLNVAGRAGRAYVDLDGQALGVCYIPDHLRTWKALLEQKSEQKLESGLIGIMGRLFTVLKRRFGNEEDIIEYVINNSDVWDDPGGDKSVPTEWTNALALLDIALLSLIGEGQCGVDDVAKVLDDVLASSFLKRRLRRYKESNQRFVSEALASRAKYICATTSTAQRRGYFFSGVGLTAGRFLDANSDELNKALLDAEDALRNRDHGRCTTAIVDIAERIFGVEPFRPNTMPDSWKDIVKGWLAGEPMDLLQSIDEDAPIFVEDALIYRLAWGVEAIRVRSRANDEQLFDERPSPIVAVIEAGTFSTQEALLLQTGLSSRIAARRALEQCPAEFETIHDMRNWLFSDPVVKASGSADWPTPDSREAWLSYVESQRAAQRNRWTVFNQDIPVRLTGAQPTRKGVPVLALQPAGSATICIYTPEFTEIGRSTHHFEPWAMHSAIGHVIDKNRIQIRYVGPTAAGKQ